MTSNIVLPNLTQFVKNHISTIIQAKTQADLESAVNAFLSKDARIVVNGHHITRSDYVQKLSVMNFDEEGSVVSFGSSVEVPADAKNPIQAGSVALYYDALISEAIRIHDAPISSQVTSSLHVVIEEDPSIPPPPPSPIHGFFDGRRVMALNQIFTQGRVTDPNFK